MDALQGNSFCAGCNFLGSSSASPAETNNEMPAAASPPYKLPVRWLIHPAAYGPTNPAEFAIELVKPRPAATADPVKSSLGREYAGPYTLNIPETATASSAIVNATGCGAPKIAIAVPAHAAGNAACNLRS